MLAPKEHYAPPELEILALVRRLTYKHLAALRPGDLFTDL